MVAIAGSRPGTMSPIALGEASSILLLPTYRVQYTGCNAVQCSSCVWLSVVRQPLSRSREKEAFESSEQHLDNRRGSLRAHTQHALSCHLPVCRGGVHFSPCAPPADVTSVTILYSQQIHPRLSLQTRDRVRDTGRTVRSIPTRSVHRGVRPIPHARLELRMGRTRLSLQTERTILHVKCPTVPYPTVRTDTRHAACMPGLVTESPAQATYVPV